MKTLFIPMILASGFIMSATTASAKVLNTKSFGTKIVGGVQATEGEIPYIVSLHANGYGHFCGGSLIAQKWVLTAAHCVQDGVDEVRVGLFDQTQSNVSEKIKPAKIYAHPKYDASTTDYDFALIELSENSSRQPIALNSNELKIVTSDMVMSMTAGWGTTKEGASTLPNILRKVSIPLVSQADCNAATSYDGAVTDRMICAGFKAGAKDSCQGDSGGPLVTQLADGTTALIGVVSWGEGCARKNKYGIYSKVNAATAWITSVIGTK